MILPPDACPRCDPGIPGPALPVGDPAPVNDGILADYDCGTCGTAWSTRFDRHGWPIERLLADAPARRAA